MYVIATVICPNFHFSVSPHVPFLNLLFEQIANSNEYLLAKFGFDTACSRPGSHPAPKQRGVVSCVGPHPRIAAVSLAEFVAVHIVLVKLSFAIKPSAVTCHMLL